MMIIIHTWPLERKGYAAGWLLCSPMSGRRKVLEHHHPG
jgi:hypothetical protein